MTDSELLERLNATFTEINEALEERGALLELNRKADLRWSGLARLPGGKLLINTYKTGKQAAPESTKPVAEAMVDLTLEGRFIARVLVYPGKAEIELPGGLRKPFDHSGIAKMFSSL